MRREENDAAAAAPAPAPPPAAPAAAAAAPAPSTGLTEAMGAMGAGITGAVSVTQQVASPPPQSNAQQVRFSPPNTEQ